MTQSVRSGSVQGVVQPRVYTSHWCQSSFTLPSLYSTFVSHQLEWSLMGRNFAWHSVLTGLSGQNATDPPPEVKEKFFDSGRGHVRMLLAVIGAASTNAELAIYREHTPSACTFKAHCSLLYLKADPRLQQPCTVGRRELLLRRAAPEPAALPFGRVLDLGCGLGRVSFALAPHARSVTCVDQSPYHLLAASREWRAQQQSQQQSQQQLQQQSQQQSQAYIPPIRFALSSPDLLLAMDGERFDFVHSVIVLQHMVPQLQQAYLEQLCDVLVIGGRGWAQVPIALADRTANTTCNMQSSRRKGGLQMHFTPAKHVVEVMEGRGCECKVMDVAQMFIGDDSTPRIASGAVTFVRVGDPAAT